MSQKHNKDDMQLRFMQGHGANEAIFILRHTQEKFYAQNKNLYFVFVDLEKAFGRIPHQLLWWTMRRLGVDKQIIQLVQAMYQNASSKVHIEKCFSDSICVNVGVHQCSVLSPLLIAIMVLEALFQECRTGCPWVLLYSHDLVNITESVEEL